MWKGWRNKLIIYNPSQFFRTSTTCTRSLKTFNQLWFYVDLRQSSSASQTRSSARLCKSATVMNPSQSFFHHFSQSFQCRATKNGIHEPAPTQKKAKKKWSSINFADEKVFKNHYFPFASYFDMRSSGPNDISNLFLSAKPRWVHS